MSGIALIIQQFNADEQQGFIRFLKMKNRRGDTKNIQLFKLIAAGKTEKLDIQLYGKPSLNAYHALHRRLKNSLVDYIAQSSLDGETSEELSILKLILAARIFFEQKHYKLAVSTLKKAEKLASQFEIYGLLTEMYHTKIQYAHLQKSVSLTSIIKAAEQNLVYFNQEQHLAMAYATIKERLANDPKISAKKIIIEVFEAYSISPNTAFTFKSLFQLMELLVTAAQIHRNYYEISGYMNELYGIVSKKESLADKHLYYHIKILHLMAVSYFRNKDFDTSLEFLEKMNFEMQKQNGVYKQLFKRSWAVLQGLNLNYNKQPLEAIKLLKKHKSSLDAQMTLMMCYFQQSQFTEAYEVLKDMHHSDQWYEKKMGWTWVIKKSIIEILLLVELDKLDLVLTRLDSFNKRFAKRLKRAGEVRVLSFIKLVRLYYDRPKDVTSSAFADKVEKSFEWIGTEREDIFVMSFYAWLKSKMEQNPVYETTLQLVRNV